MLAGYLCCLVLVPVYVNLFGVWQLLNSNLGSRATTLLPPLLTALLLGAILAFRRRRGADDVSWPVVGWGLGICVAALLVPDPAFPAKRIHVAEYCLLAGIARYAMSFRLQGTQLFWSSLLFAGVLGCHDEFLQGLHPDRTYGLRDMLVNLLGAAGGALIWQGLRFFSNRRLAVSAPAPRLDPWSLTYLGWLLLTVVALVIPFSAYTGTAPLPLWPAVPLAGCGVLLCLYYDRFSPHWRHGLVAVTAASLLLLLYPLVSHVPYAAFY